MIDARDEELLKNGNYIHASAEGMFGANVCAVGGCVHDDPLEVAAKMEAAHRTERS